MTGTDSTLVYRPASELARAIASGELRSEMLVERFLERIERLDTKLHAFIDVYADDARSAAGAADRAIAAGHGEEDVASVIEVLRASRASAF